MLLHAILAAHNGLGRLPAALKTQESLPHQLAFVLRV